MNLLFSNSSKSMLSSSFANFLPSSKAKLIRDSRWSSGLRSLLVLSPPLQLGHDFLVVVLMYFSMQSLQNLCEHLR